MPINIEELRAMCMVLPTTHSHFIFSITLNKYIPVSMYRNNSIGAFKFTVLIAVCAVILTVGLKLEKEGNNRFLLWFCRNLVLNFRKGYIMMKLAATVKEFWSGEDLNVLLLTNRTSVLLSLKKWNDRVDGLWEHSVPLFSKNNALGEYLCAC